MGCNEGRAKSPLTPPLHWLLSECNFRQFPPYVQAARPQVYGSFLETKVGAPNKGERKQRTPALFHGWKGYAPAVEHKLSSRRKVRFPSVKNALPFG